MRPLVKRFRVIPEDLDVFAKPSEPVQSDTADEDQERATWFSGTLESACVEYKYFDRRSDEHLRRTIASIALLSCEVDQWPELRPLIATSLEQKCVAKFRSKKQTHCIARIITHAVIKIEINKANRYARCADLIKGKFTTVDDGADYIRRHGGIDEINTK